MAIGDKEIREQNARDVGYWPDAGCLYVGDPKYKKGTPEYEQYRNELLTELKKFTNGEPPYK